MTEEEKHKAITSIASYVNSCIRFSITEINKIAKTKEDAEFLYAKFEYCLMFALCSRYFTDEKGNINTDKTEKCLIQLNKDFTRLILGN